MSKPSALTILALIASCAPLSWAQAPQAADLPPGEMQAKARTACLECHEARIILQQRLNKAAWTREVDKMIKWGALVDPKDRDGLIDYFSANFPAEKAPEPAVRVRKKQLPHTIAQQQKCRPPRCGAMRLRRSIKLSMSDIIPGTRNRF